MIHVALFLASALWLPIGIAEIAPPGPGQEALWVPLLLLASIGPVFFVVSAQATLMQRWFAADPRAADPYYLYASSNLARLDRKSVVSGKSVSVRVYLCVRGDIKNKHKQIK